MKTSARFRLCPFPSVVMPVGVILLAALVSSLHAQGLPPASRDNIHKLFESHASVRRSVTLTETGYIAVTESDDPQVAKTLRSHVNQMQERLESGLAVRRWDPAYDEMVRQYKDLDLKVEATEKGLRAIMTGKTTAAVKVAQNHAHIVSQFIACGWEEHDVRHPTVTEKSGEAPSSKAPSSLSSAPCNAGNCCRNACNSGKPSQAPN